LAWQDRDYNRGGGAEDYFSNPAAILGFSIPFGTWFGSRVRLHFWLLLTFAFAIAGGFRFPLNCLIGIALLLVTLLLHDFAHKIAAILLEGRHDEFMLWPAGGLIFPSIPPGAGAMFMAYAAPMAMHATIAAACMFAARADWALLPLNPLSGFGWGSVAISMATLRGFLFATALVNWGLFLINLLPYYWFDGGCLLQSILTPFAGGFQAINITCIIGMILAVPMAGFSLMGGDFLGLVMWALLFSSSFSRRRQLQAEGTGELADAIAFSASQSTRTGPRGRKWFAPDFAKKAAQRSAKIRREQQKIDQILAKVSKSGMHSLSWLDRRALRKATERQRRGER
jgi:stage IV sporulation protein FB